MAYRTEKVEKIHLNNIERECGSCIKIDRKHRHTNIAHLCISASWKLSKLSRMSLEATRKLQLVRTPRTRHGINAWILHESDIKFKSIMLKFFGHGRSKGVEITFENLKSAAKYAVTFTGLLIHLKSISAVFRRLARLPKTSIDNVESVTTLEWMI